MRGHLPRRSGLWLGLALVLVFGLSGCTLHDDEGDTPTAVSRPASTSTPTAASGAKPSATTTGTKPAGTALTDANGQQISDGVCQALIPDGWVDDGTCHGTTASGARYVLFGVIISTDSEWQAAQAIIATPAAGRTIAHVSQDASSIRVTYTGDKGFEYRKRFGDRYCDFTVYRASGAVPADELAVWDQVLATLGPVQ
jgi:hypothetical protein